VPIQPGTKLGQYEVKEFIGQGAMGYVYRAYHPQLERTGAVKVLQAITPDPDTTARFRHEAQAIAQMRHPNILNVYDFGEYEGTPYMIVEYVAGGSLADRIRSASVDQAIALKYLRGIASALDHAHSLGIVHRDVKPANVLLGRDDQPILADFGLAKLLQGSSLKSMTGVTTGTPAYMAPEQVTGSKVGPPADRYSLATIAYELFTGSIPFDGEGVLELLYAQVHREPPLPSSRKPELGRRVDAVLMRGLAKDPGARWPSCQAFVDALAAALSGAALPSVEKTEVMAIPDELPVAYPSPPSEPPPPMNPVVPSRPGAAPTVAMAMSAAAVASTEPMQPSEAPAAQAPPARRSRRRLFVILAAVVILLLVVGGVLVYAAAHPPQPTLSLSSDTVQAGDTVVVSGSHLPANQSGEIEVIGSVRTASFRADGGGAFSVQVTVPRDIVVGDHIVRMCWSGACHGESTMHVTAPLALASPTPTPNSTPTPTGSTLRSPTPTASGAPTPLISLSVSTVKVGGPFMIAGRYFDSHKPVVLYVVQLKVAHSLGPAAGVTSSGAFEVTVTMPSGVTPGTAQVYACSYSAGASPPPDQCASHPIEVTS
jgi:serine/threonine protein kinase